MELPLKLLKVCVLASMLGAAAVQAQEEEAGFSLEVGFDHSSRYIFRGVDLLEGRGTPVPRLSVSRGKLTGYYYGYISEIGDAGPDYEEHDFGVEYAASAGRLSLTLGSVAYTYRKPLDYEDELEVYAIAGVEAPLSPTLTVFYDAKGFGGGYASLAVSHDFALVGDRLGLGLSTALGYDLGYYSDVYGEGPGSGLNDLLLGADLSWRALDALSFHVLVQRAIALDVMDEIGQKDQTLYTFGTALNF